MSRLFVVYLCMRWPPVWAQRCSLLHQDAWLEAELQVAKDEVQRLRQALGSIMGICQRVGALPPDSRAAAGPGAAAAGAAASPGKELSSGNHTIANSIRPAAELLSRGAVPDGHSSADALFSTDEEEADQ